MVKVQIPIGSDIEEDEEEDRISDETDDEIGDPDWEEVKSNDGGGGGGRDSQEDQLPILPAEGVTINIGPASKRPRRGRKRGKATGDDDDDEDEDFGEKYVDKKKKKEIDLNEMIRKRINRVKITEQLMKHKMSLCLYLARGLRLVKIVNCNIIVGLSLSIVERFKLKGKMKDERAVLNKFLSEFSDIIGLSSDDEVREKHMQQPFMLNMLDCYANYEATNLIELVVMFVACFKAFKPKTPIRIVNILRPISLIAKIIPKPASPTSTVDLTEEADVKQEEEEVVVEEVKQNGSKPVDTKKGSKTRKSGRGKKTVTKKEAEIKVEQNNNVVPPDTSGGGIIERLDFWVEVYLTDEKKWCCVDLVNLKLDEPNVLVELGRPFNYMVSFDVDEFCVKPAERNYCANWYTIAFRKGRCEDKWWDSLMANLGPERPSDKDRADENKLEEVLTKKDMPSSDAAFKNHPLYVLEKHLLKFQGIYPPEVAPMGFFKDIPVYPRACVQTLMSRETWLRQARTVKLNETPYKIVKARPKRDKFTGELIRDLPLELFGEWQTQPYDPPEAKDGKVPRNCYGNVDMYQPCMLPKGCVWLKLDGLGRIAKKLNIDVAAAVVGFDNHCGSYGAHPVLDGFIVCQEHAETLQMAWDEEQVNAYQRDEAKRQKRVWDNWRRLIKAMLIRERLRVKYKNS